MAPKQSTASSRGRPSKSSRGGSKPKATAPKSRASTSKRAAQQQQEDSEHSDVDPFADSQPDAKEMEVEETEAEAEAMVEGDDEEEDGAKKTIPPELLTRLLHEFFEKDGTRISKDANKAVAKYMDVFVREAIARAAVEKESGFLEVEDLEKVAPQLLLDL